ncbi:MAG: acetate--CoA ligase family protein [Nanoarchaeota archaeon]
MKILTEKEAEDFLEKEGFEIIARSVAKSKKQLEITAETIKFPWAMKIISKKIIHKRAAGGVILDISNIEQAESALNVLSELEGYERAIIQPMISGSELILGLKKTPEFGLAIMIGKGGSDVEKEKDISFRVLPITQRDAKEMLSELKFYKSLKKSDADLVLIEKNIMQLSDLAKKFSKIEELDINPLIINGKSALIVDARIVFS